MTACLRNTSTLLLSLSLMVGRLSAQLSSEPTDAAPFGPLLIPSRFLPAWPNGVLFEGDVHLPVGLYSRTARLRSIGQLRVAQVDSAGYTATGAALFFLPHFTFRQWSGKVEPSAPVLTPTFNPGFEFSVYRLTTRARGKKASWWFPSIASTSRTGSLHALQGRLAHYSNGQAGCLYQNQSIDSVGKCRPSVAVGSPLNVRDGSFSTNYVELGYAYSTLLFDQSLLERVRVGMSTTARWHPACCGMDGELARAYGRSGLLTRLELRTRHDSSFGLTPNHSLGRFPITLNLTVEYEQAFQRDAAFLSQRFAIEPWVAFPRLYGLGVVARWATGFDYYNIGFGRKIGGTDISSWSFGLMLDHSTTIALTRQAREATRRVFR
jgi:hypothetical protein